MLIMKTFLVMGFGALSIIRPSMQLFMICKCVLSRKKFLTNQALMSLFFMYTSNMSSKFTFFLNVLSQRSHLKTKSGSNEYDKLEKIHNYFIHSKCVIL